MLSVYGGMKFSERVGSKWVPAFAGMTRGSGDDEVWVGLALFRAKLRKLPDIFPVFFPAAGLFVSE